MTNACIEIVEEPYRYLVSLHGELEIAAIQPCHERLAAMDPAAKPWEFDLARVEYLDVAWFQLLISVQRLAAEHRQTISLRNVSARIRSQLDAFGATEHLALADTCLAAEDNCV